MLSNVPRRRWLLIASGSALALLLAGAAAFAVTNDEPQPAALDVATPATTLPAPEPTPTPAPTATATARASAAPTTTAPPVRRTAPARTTSAPPKRPPTPNKPACMHAGVVDVPNPYNSGVITVSARMGAGNKICPGERIKVTWVSYGPASGGGSVLYRSGSHYIDREHPKWTFTVVTPDVCDDSWYVVKGNVTIPRTIKKGVTPFGLAKVHWDGPRPC
ncbi:hypothetical protein SAMN05421812_116139 [Asanoa hainanensis]|uniref:Uncharacterized protein n=1 Tax=Asanoa hainanensis TaxID=560556 RepID=A0A239PCP8_9ACTN|nr:hypothetical protein [Asanoa hainanensis]SNT64189.1 hypothetical protein SAMN05421812_116139 [Asanoa hainanensis]